MSIENRIISLKGMRDRLLTFHKHLIDREKLVVEKDVGRVIAPGEWLGMLMGEERHGWLRSISKLVVRIDEAMEVNDGIAPETVEKLIAEIGFLFDESESHQEFKERVSSRMPEHPEADAVRKEILEILAAA